MVNKLRSHYLIDIPTIPDQRGKLAVLEYQGAVLFDIKRVYYLFDVPAGTSRGGHAHRELDQLLIAISGSFTVDVEGTDGKSSYVLNRPNQALYIGSMVWREMRDFSSNAVCLVLASSVYTESDYIRSYGEFARLLGSKQ
ncbi:WxcM-like domain-containing protein [Rhizobium sp. B230/85]|uniref:sugar 3,4-ketoisomerase n=1 Tax=unclassified Rhizobium TaxID=2613769 RepID=UPI001ADCE306|nr:MULTISPECIES: FdtA/QdtA family cupin domain-containing protein [unclassified Rhizobium]MBO9136824.1 WxcM-like domain-containing protein [Rhizobium sp. B209b/85]QXZ99002.1 WxcM-like domain-containing protein [Rhizobium sp. B230/85]